MPPASALRSASAGSLAPGRILVRASPAADATLASEAFEAPLAPGDAHVGPLVVSVAVEGAADCAIWSVRVQNASATPVRVEAVGLGFAWTPRDPTHLRFLRQGNQSWSYAGGDALDDAGTAPFTSGSWLRGFHRSTWEAPADRAGWHEADGVTVAGAPDAALAIGALESGRAFGVAYLRRDGPRVRAELEQRVERSLDPGETLELESVRVALGAEPSTLLEAHAEAQGRLAGARTFAPFQAGWCSWYHFFHDVTEDAFLRNLDALVAARSEIPIELVQLDDGYQRAIGDWLETNEKFPSGLPAIAAAVRAAGFTPGLWTAPFCVVPESRVHQDHRDWLLLDPEGRGDLRGLHHAVWTKEGWVFVLDASRPEVVAHLARTYRALTEMGFPYHKIDFLYTESLRARAHDARLTRAARLRRGLDAVRAGVGDESFLLGCGCPLGPAVGVVDGMRIGPDTGPHWNVQWNVPVFEEALPSGRNALRNTLSRAWMHRRSWVDDPDCLMARSEQSSLTRDEVRALAASIAVTGGMTIFSDDVPALSAEERSVVAETIALAREVDESAQAGTARVPQLLAAEIPMNAVARAGADWLVALFNDADEKRRVTLDLALHGVAAPDAEPEPLLGSPAAGRHAGVVAVELAPHGGALYRLRGAPRLAVFCDFDGTFAVQDVGSTLARRYAAEKRAQLWPRLERGELDAWQYNMELLEDLVLPEAELEAFLRTIELDPGARALVEWCEQRGVPFRVLSDGFDRNLDRLQVLHRLRFAYDANRLRYEAGRWRIAPGSPDPDCGCGTGTCKRARIAAFRARHPGARVVHVGNGRVSDLCAAEAADRVFAKDTLAEELASRGVAFEPFETLHDVVASLDADGLPRP